MLVDGRQAVCLYSRARSSRPATHPRSGQSPRLPPEALVPGREVLRPEGARLPLPVRPRSAPAQPVRPALLAHDLHIPGQISGNISLVLLPPYDLSTTKGANAGSMASPGLEHGADRDAAPLHPKGDTPTVANAERLPDDLGHGGLTFGGYGADLLDDSGREAVPRHWRCLARRRILLASLTMSLSRYLPLGAFRSTAFAIAW